MRWAHLGHPAVSASVSNPLVFPFAFVVFSALRGQFLSCCRVEYRDAEDLAALVDKLGYNGSCALTCEKVT